MHQRDARVSCSAMQTPWKRFWCPVDGSYSLGDEGFLVDPASAVSRALQPEVVELPSLASMPCLALLGEPGMGKSTALRQVIQDSVKDQSSAVLAIDLREYGDESRLERAVFHSDAFRAWVEGDGRLTLFLDSLDECSVRIPTVAALLLAGLDARASILERLSLRIACRTANWPRQFEERLPALWGKEYYAAYELLPLTRRNVEDAAEAAGLEASDFVADVIGTGAQPLAIRPITLNFLIARKLATGSLSSSRVDLYEQGCLLLAAESSSSRRDSGSVGDLNANDRLAVASRVGALTVLGNCPTITISEARDPLPGEVNILDIVGTTEPGAIGEFEVRVPQVMEALGTALFAGRGAGCMGFAHQTYAEFLAARYIASRNLKLDVIRSLLLHPDAQGMEVVPQLGETAGWLACYRSDVFDLLLTSSPELLLRSDAVTSQHARRPAVVAAYLAAVEQNRIRDQWTLAGYDYRRLAHEGLPQQLQPYVRDPARPAPARSVAIEIAEDTGASALVPSILELALDSSAPAALRRRAVRAVDQLGGEEEIRELTPLIRTKASPDVDPDIQGLALRALWRRRLIPLGDVLSAMTRPADEDSIGPYRIFVERDLGPSLSGSEALVALTWLAETYSPEDLASSVPIQRFAVQIFSKALRELPAADAMDSVSRSVVREIWRRSTVLRRDLDVMTLLSAAHRRAVAANVIRSRPADAADALLFAGMSWLDAEDFGWALSKYATLTDGGAEVEAFAQIARSLLDIRRADHVDTLAEQAETTPAIRDRFRDLIEPVTLNSAAAKERREQYERYRRPSSETDRPRPDPPVEAQVEALLDEFEAGDTQAWWRLNRLMLFDEMGIAKATDLEYDLRKLPGWKNASVETRQRMLRAAGEYLREGEPGTEHWLGLGKHHRPALAGYRALVLLANEHPRALLLLDDAVWGRWAAIILGCPVSVTIVGDEQPALLLVARACDVARDECIGALETIFARENMRQEHAHWFTLRKLADAWDLPLMEAVLAIAQRLPPRVEGVSDVLSELLPRGFLPARTWAEGLLGKAVRGPEERAVAAAAAVCLILYAHDAGWGCVWPALQSDPDFGRAVVEAIAEHWDEGHSRSLREKLSAAQLADLYMWLVRQYPHCEDPQIEGAHSVGTREAVADYRDSLLGALVERGSRESLESLKVVAAALPDLPWLERAVTRAEQVTLRKTWSPMSPLELLRLFHPVAGGGRRRVVFPLHGIRTRAAWQRAFSDVAQEAGWRCRLGEWFFGWFSALSLLIGRRREAKIQWLRKTYYTETRMALLGIDERPSIVAHSFGTYILGHALLRYPYLRFDKVILCGSILPIDYPWEDLIRRGQVQAVHNECGVRDIWAGCVGLFVAKSGCSGRRGFSTVGVTWEAEIQGRFEQRRFDYAHSEYFEKGHMAEYWMPFLGRDFPLLPTTEEPCRTPKANWPVLTYVLGAAGLAGIIMGVTGLL